MDERRRGSLDDGHGQRLPPEEINDDSPLIRDSQSPTPRPIGEKAIYRIVHSLLHKAGLLKRNKNGGYEFGPHSIRKFFKTQLLTLGIEENHVDYWMGLKTSVYADMESEDIEYHREPYSKAGLRIRPREAGSKIDLLKQMVGSLGATPDEIRAALDSLAKPGSTQRRKNAKMRGSVLSQNCWWTRSETVLTAAPPENPLGKTGEPARTRVKITANPFFRIRNPRGFA